MPPQVAPVFLDRALERFVRSVNGVELHPQLSPAA